MTSTNEHLPPPPKPRMSPLDFRNTDLVSRLLAATPPYLYNMSLLPNTYFFSEMLRSFVQAKADSSANARQHALNLPSTNNKRTRKRPWSSTRTMESYQKANTPPKVEQQQSNDWMLKNYPEPKPVDSPLELTTKEPERKPDLAASASSSSTTAIFSPQESNPSGLILPPPPPIWYPPLYPAAPYGIDPLHFFIDLRVSGHIYDKKKAEEVAASELQQQQQQQEPKEEVNHFKQSRHASAFSVPTNPMNLSHAEDVGNQESKGGGVTSSSGFKFDVKSMVGDDNKNKTGTNYIMSNIGNIYKNVNNNLQTSRLLQLHQEEEMNRTLEANENNNETEEQRQKRVKDLRALIGLELVVDYMSHARPGSSIKAAPRSVSITDESTDVESIGSPALEVVAVQDET